MKRRIIYAGLIVSVVVITAMVGGYTTWNTLNPVNTCAQCHEVSPSYATWGQSAHAKVRCIDCHGTALSHGAHSQHEKTTMMWTHFTGDKRNSDIRLTEAQMLDVVAKCASCHQAEHAGWMESGHAATYQDIFMDKEHNRIEKPYADCFRCHGMFYESDLHTLMSLEGEADDWHIHDKTQASHPSITCLSCHKIHTPNPVSRRWISTDSIPLPDRAPHTALYIRADKMHLRADHLTPVQMVHGDTIIRAA
ncbi:hypothetical protein EZS27_025225, partial [termite gut metagenome]